MTVTLYGTSTCIWCTKTRAFFTEHKVRYKDVDVGASVKSAEEMIKKSRQQSVPVIDANEKIIVGYDENELRRALHIR